MAQNAGSNVTRGASYGNIAGPAGPQLPSCPSCHQTGMSRAPRAASEKSAPRRTRSLRRTGEAGKPPGRLVDFWWGNFAGQRRTSPRRFLAAHVLNESCSVQVALRKCSLQVHCAKGSSGTLKVAKVLPRRSPQRSRAQIQKQLKSIFQILSLLPPRSIKRRCYTVVQLLCVSVLAQACPRKCALASVLVQASLCMCARASVLVRVCSAKCARASLLMQVCSCKCAHASVSVQVCWCASALVGDGSCRCACGRWLAFFLDNPSQ